MSAISQKSIIGITSITTPAGVDNQFTLHNNNTTEAVKLDNAGNLHFHNHLNITGVSTFSGGIGSTITIAAGVGSTAITLDNSHQIAFGSANELAMFHDGTNSYIKQRYFSYPSRLKIISENSSIDIMSGSGGGLHGGYENAIQCENNGAVKLYWAGFGPQLETTNGGIIVQGNITLGQDIIHHGDTDTKIRFPAANTITAETAGSERLRITSSGHIAQGGGAEPSSSNGSVALKYGIKSNANNVIIGETTSSSNNVGLHIESRQTGRSGNARFAQIGLKNDAGGGGQLTFFTAASGADVTEKMNISSSGVIEAKSNSIRFYSSGSNPSSPQNGDTYYNTTDNALKCYVNGTWLNAAGEGNIVSSGTTAVYTVGGQKYLSHAITSSGIVTVSGNTMEVDYLIIAGGGGGGCLGGGGGAGGALTGTAKQLNPGTYSVTVGAGGLNGGDNVPGATGGNTTAFGLTALGGGGGGSHDGGSNSAAGTNGGSGGGGSDNNNNGAGPGSGTSGQGNNGGAGIPAYNHSGGTLRGGGGGGGAGAVGKNYNTLDNGNYGNGGIGLQNAYETGSNNYYAGGGGRGSYAGTNNHAGDGGHGGGGGGSKSGGGSGNAGDAGLASANSRQGSAGQVTGGGPGGSGGANTGGGGGCNSWNHSGGASGGSGIIIIRYKIAS